MGRGQGQLAAPRGVARTSEKMFYHLSPVVPLSDLLLHPRVPVNKMKGEEDTLARICVATSIAGCLLSINDERTCQEREVVVEPYQTFYVYRCRSDFYYRPTSSEVGDVDITDEHWLFHPTSFEKDGRVFVSINQMAWARHCELLPRPKWGKLQD